MQSTSGHGRRRDPIAHAQAAKQRQHGEEHARRRATAVVPREVLWTRRVVENPSRYAFEISLITAVTPKICANVAMGDASSLNTFTTRSLGNRHGQRLSSGARFYGLALASHPRRPEVLPIPVRRREPTGVCGGPPPPANAGLAHLRAPPAAFAAAPCLRAPPSRSRPGRTCASRPGTAAAARAAAA